MGSTIRYVFAIKLVWTTRHDMQPKRRLRSETYIKCVALKYKINTFWRERHVVTGLEQLVLSLQYFLRFEEAQSPSLRCLVFLSLFSILSFNHLKYECFPWTHGNHSIYVPISYRLIMVLIPLNQLKCTTCHFRYFESSTPT